MKKPSLRSMHVALALVLSFAFVPAASAHIPSPPQPTSAEDTGPDDEGHQHGEEDGHLAPSRRAMELVGKVQLTNIPGGISDVSANPAGTHAFLNTFSSECPSNGGTGNGVHVVDITDPANPVKIGFMPMHPNSRPGEGAHVIYVDTRSFTGDIYIANNEPCDAGQPHNGGITLWDVTNPAAPVLLADGVGDDNPDKGLASASPTHSAFGWFTGRRAFVMATDNAEITDVDIFEITDPLNPVQIAETSILDWPPAQSPLAYGENVFHHDMQVKRFDTARGPKWFALISYWDAGWVILDVSAPARPRFVGDTDYPRPDALTGFDIPEGNGHQAWWSADNQYFIGTDEDFSPFRVNFEITTGPNAGPYGASQFGWTVPISENFEDGVLNGPTIWGGSGCVEDTDNNGISDRDEVPPAESLEAGPGEEKTVVFSRGVCFFSIKVESGQLAGYDAVIIGNSHGGTRGGLTPNAFICGSAGHEFEVTASAICIGHRAMHLLFNDEPEYTPVESSTFPPGGDMPPIGTVGEDIVATTVFDGWGYIHLYDANTLEWMDAYAVPEALDPAFATGFGNLTVHEVETDPRLRADGTSFNLGYLSWYAAGARVVTFGPEGLTEVGHFIDEGGNDFWGIHPIAQGRDRPLLLFSDRDYGLYILRYTGRQ